MNRLCKKCRHTLHIEAFPAGSHKCKKCRNAEISKRRREDPSFRERCIAHQRKSVSKLSEEEREVRRQRSLAWYYKNRIRANENTRRWQAAKRRQSLQFRIRRNLCNRIKAVVTRGHKSDSTLRLLGCDLPFFLKWLESKFKPGMTWDNYGEWHIDHETPCAAFDLTDPVQQSNCFHYSNLQPLWAEENRRKGARV